MIGYIKSKVSPLRKLVFNSSGKKPWSYGYNDVRWDLIAQSINNQTLLDSFKKGEIPRKFGIGFDERVVEYPWIFSRLPQTKETQLLDAGSTLNFHPFVELENVKNKQLTIFTYYPEPINFVDKRISYMFGDLRHMPFRDELYNTVICQSTIEHVDMDNSIYGYSINKNEDEQKKSYDYLKVIDELIRVLKPGGKLLLTFPYGRFENHGFFQQFDEEMVSKITHNLNVHGKSICDYLLYQTTGWKFANKVDCDESVSFNPHTGKGKGEDGAAHCRCVCCIEFIKK